MAGAPQKGPLPGSKENPLPSGLGPGPGVFLCFFFACARSQIRGAIDRPFSWVQGESSAFRIGPGTLCIFLFLMCLFFFILCLAAWARDLLMFSFSCVCLGGRQDLVTFLYLCFFVGSGGGGGGGGCCMCSSRI